MNAVVVFAVRVAFADCAVAADAAAALVAVAALVAARGVGIAEPPAQNLALSPPITVVPPRPFCLVDFVEYDVTVRSRRTQ